MSSSCWLIVPVLFLVSPITGHRFITGPTEVQPEVDSVMVSSDPIKITNKKYNKSNKTKTPDYAIRFNQNQVTDDRNLETTRLHARSFKDCKHYDIKCLYDMEASVEKVEPQIQPAKNQDIISKFLEQYSAITNAKFNQEGLVNKTESDEDKLSAESSDLKKSYWSLVNSERHHHPYDDKKGWVTLEPVPWSSSKVSKWQSNVQPSNPHQSQQPDNKPWNYGQLQRPTTAHLWVTNRPSAEQDNYPQYTKPSNHFSSHKPVSHWGIGTNDIITDNKPSDFPSGHGGYSPYKKPTYQMENSFNQKPWHYHDSPHLTNSYPANRPSRVPASTGHPATYPDEGNGEWVLLSTTKGYSLPNKYRNSPRNFLDEMGGDPDSTSESVPVTSSRNMKLQDISRYHEEDIDDKYVLVSRSAPGPGTNRKSGTSIPEESRANVKNPSPWSSDAWKLLHGENEGDILTSGREPTRHGKNDWNDNTGERLVNVLEPNTEDSPVTTYKRTVRLTVLPPLNKTSTTSHGGLLEVDNNYQTVDEAHQEDLKLKKLGELAKVKKSQFGQYTMIPVPVKSTVTDVGQRSASVLAAVGAGMIPATMAVLLPMAFGRKRRSISSTLKTNSSHPGFKHISSW